MTGNNKIVEQMCPTTEINKDRGDFTDEMLNGRQLTFHPGAQRPTQDSS